MRVLMIAFEFPPQGGGIGTYAYQIASGLHRSGYSITALAMTHHMLPEEIEQFDQKQDFRILRFRWQKNRLLTIIGRLKITLRLLFREKYDFVFIANESAGILGVLAKHLFSVPYVIAGHGSEFLLKGRLRRMIRDLSYRQSSLVLLNSDFSYQHYREAGLPVDLARVVSLGADEAHFNEKNADIRDIRKKHQLGQRPVLLTVGSISERKGQAFVVSALEYLKPEFPDILYMIVGTGPAEVSLKKQIQAMNLEDNVLFCGRVAQEDLPAYYAACDIFVLNSTILEDGSSEGFGIVLIEANLLKKPVVGTRGCGIEDAIENEKSGFLVEMNDPRDTAAKITKLLRDPELRMRMGLFGYNRAISNYTWKAVSSVTEKNLRDVFSQEL